MTLQLLFIYLIHVSVLSGLVYWLWRYSREILSSKLFYAALAAKVLAGLGLGLLYQYHYQGGDTWSYYEQARQMALLPFKDFWLELTQPLQSSQPVRAIWFTRGVSLMVYLGQLDYWLCAVYFSLISFASSIYGLKSFCKWNESYRMPFFFSFMFIPSLVFWSSGLLKESIGFAAFVIVVGFYARLRARQIRIWDYLLLVCGLVFLIVIKYYIAALLLPALIFLRLYHLEFDFWKRWHGLSKSLLIAVLMIFPAYVFLYWLSPNFRGLEFLQVVQQNHDWILTKSDEVNGLNGSGLSGVMGVFADVFYYTYSAIIRPLAFESFTFPAILSGTENFALLLIAIGFWIKKESHEVNIEAIVSLIYVLLCAGLLAYSVPNLGTVARYKVYYMPVLLFLVFNLKRGFLNRANQ
ncbi:hypothetical protein [Reichenbachiella ulvae]|uniref:Dolichyl-phosphate-mannose-protein mannosyltransferase n=1 Tax=Reichenbachiella ulvae TaxID=2980104 RepID=A0ABT3CXM7_9BACT|nr:hypothetical protein [Reichenbachiella ulvae]MCV9387958.1 hypothetical protein [Reichenbachiella ulvae]